MTGRERLAATLAHREPDRVCVDFGATFVTGMHVSAVTRLRRELLGQPEYRVKVIEPYQMLGEIDDELRRALGIDVIGRLPRKTIFGTESKDWKPFTLFDGTEVLVSGDFNVTVDPDTGDLLMYPEGDTTAPPSGRMPKGGYFFDAIVRQEPIEESRLDPADNCEEFAPLSEEDIEYYRRAALWFDERADYGTVLVIPGAAFGDIALVPAPWMKHPKGIRDVGEWYASLATRPDYVRQVFERQCEIALENIKTLIELLGDRVQVALVTGTDFGTQQGPFMSRKMYRELFMPFHKAVNDAIHKQSNWK
ncbi:MAG TPA: methyltransferase, partial [Planctomycetaceae bacterium]|nr:methyltransferase [Planctomycetaceae bacterium]